MSDNTQGARHKTPVIRQPRKKGGTLYVFPSATEDIGLNLNERRNKVTLTHYALLNIPVSDNLYPLETLTENLDNIEERRNRFNPFNIPGHLKDSLEEVDNAALNTPSRVLAASLQNYAFNFETVLRNQPTYDYSNPVTVSERVFWKWLKETGAIRWTYDKMSKTFVEEPEIERLETGEVQKTGYQRVVQCIGEIKTGANTYDTYGVFNETYVNVPSSYGGTVQYFKQYIDDNYDLGTAYPVGDYLEGFDEDFIGNTVGVGDVMFSDGRPYTDITSDSKTNTAYTTQRDGSNPWWYGEQIKNFPGADKADSTLNAYITDPYIEDDYLTESIDDTLNTDLYYNAEDFNAAGQTNTQTRVFKRSNIDSISLVTNINEVRQIYGLNQPDLLKQEGLSPLTLSYDNIAIDLADKKEFEFNTVLIYYSIFDQSGQNVIATNLFGVLFLECPVDDRDASEKTGAISKFHLPVYKKIKSDADGFGTSYSLRINLKTFDVYDNTEGIINDKTTSNALIEENFNSVLHNLVKSIDILQRSVDTNSYIKSQYAEFDLKANKILKDNIELKKYYDNLIKSKQSYIKTKHLISDDLTTNKVYINPDATDTYTGYIDFIVTQEAPEFNELFLRDLTKEESAYIDKTRIDLRVEPNQARSYRFDSNESAFKDGWQKLEYVGDLIKTDDEDIIRKIREQKNLTTKRGVTNQDDYAELAGDDTYILNLVRNQLDIRFAESVNPIDTSVDSVIDLNSKTYKNVSAYVNHKIPELIISPSSAAFNDETGLVPELLKYSSNYTSDDNQKYTEAEINYIKLIPYIIKVIQMIDPKYFVSQASIDIKSDQVPDLEHRKTTIAMDADGTMADKSVKSIDDNSERLTFKINIRHGNITIKTHYPLFETGNNEDAWNEFRERLRNYISHITAKGGIRDNSSTIVLERLEPRQCAALMVLSYMCKDRLYNGLLDTNIIHLGDEEAGTDVTDEDTFVLGNISWVWFNFNNNYRQTALNKDLSLEDKVDMINDMLTYEPEKIQTQFISGLGYFFDGLPAREGQLPQDIDSSFTSPSGLYVNNVIYESDGSNGIIETVNFTPYIEVYNGSGPDPRINGGLHHDHSRYCYLEVVLLSGQVTSDDGTIEAMTNQESVIFCIRQRPNIEIENNTGGDPMIYSATGDKALDENGDFIDPELTIHAIGTLADDDKKHRFRVSHTSNGKEITISVDDEGIAVSDPEGKIVEKEEEEKDNN